MRPTKLNSSGLRGLEKRLEKSLKGFSYFGTIYMSVERARRAVSQTTPKLACGLNFGSRNKAQNSGMILLSQELKGNGSGKDFFHGKTPQLLEQLSSLMEQHPSLL